MCEKFKLWNISEEIEYCYFKIQIRVIKSLKNFLFLRALFECGYCIYFVCPIVANSVINRINKHGL